MSEASSYRPIKPNKAGKAGVDYANDAATAAADAKQLIIRIVGSIVVLAACVFLLAHTLGSSASKTTPRAQQSASLIMADTKQISSSINQFAASLLEVSNTQLAHMSITLSMITICFQNVSSVFAQMAEWVSQ